MSDETEDLGVFRDRARSFVRANLRTTTEDARSLKPLSLLQRRLYPEIRGTR